ncbi:relaxase/mobilization nuclease domain-containing protein [Campylobacter sp.]|uniref:relaxase/mobilization nuclease domain-containing protein n=1 Tax=Campylobacter sp. TaxID=205 RepID=UPI00259D3034|nr:relaxase/mobilization nuclease domain-containing protein [Campylobacter sp.]MBQ3167490.1 relaxase/mobilization nuclease domain-containing protein [Campylobacter sp.]
MSKFNYEDWLEEYNQIKGGGRVDLGITHKKIFFNSISAKSIKKNFTSSKQSVVKTISNLTKQGTSNCIKYILKNSEDGYAINQYGEKANFNDIMQDWSKDFSNNPNSKESLHLVFSIKEDCNSRYATKALKKAVKDTMENNFYEYKYAMVLHTHQNNPHIHVVINKNNILTKKKMHFKNKSDIKEFFNKVREDFTYSLNIHGLRDYTNKSSLEKDLKAEYNKVKDSLNMDTNCKDKITNIYRSTQKNLEMKKIDTDIKINRLKNSYDELKKKRIDLIDLINLYQKKNNKKRFKLYKELKEINKELKMIESHLKQEIKKYEDLNRKIQTNKDNSLEHYKDSSRDLILQENFCYNFKNLHSKGLTSKSDYEAYIKVKNSIEVTKKLVDENAKISIDNSLVYAKVFGNDKNNIFNLSKKLDSLDKTIHILKQSDMNFEEYFSYLKQLEKNKEFLSDLIDERFEKIEKIVKEKGGNIDRDSFIYKEYKKALNLLNKESVIKENQNFSYSKSKVRENEVKNKEIYLGR